MDEKLEKAKTAVSELFSDNSVPESKTVEALKELRDEIDMLIETLVAQLGG